jgi:hypothetical protein
MTNEPAGEPQTDERDVETPQKSDEMREADTANGENPDDSAGDAAPETSAQQNQQ